MAGGFLKWLLQLARSGDLTPATGGRRPDVDPTFCASYNRA
jgi:hypothetical protein